jgi:hypothetical protein
MPGGVTYIKISKTDKEGVDRSGFIRQLETLRIIYDANDIKEYKIRNIQPQGDSYWCAVSPVSQSDDLEAYSVLDYRAELTPSSNSGSFKTIGDSRFFTASYTVESNNTLGYFNTSSGAYTLGDIPNIRLEVEADKVDITFVSTPVGSPTAQLCLTISSSFAFNNTGSITCSDPVPLSTSNPSNPNERFTLFWDQSSSLFYKGSRVIPVIRIRGTNIPVDTFNWDDLNFRIVDNESNTVNPTSSGDNKLTLFEPDGANWDYNDFNPLFNNAEVSRLSTQFLDVDYESGLTTPLNFIPIISGTAVHAPVQDSNYASKAWSNLRYNGVRSSSPGFNQNLDFGGFGNIPNVEQNQTFFAYFDSVQNTFPIIKNQTSYNIKYLIDSAGEVYQSAPLTPALYNLIDSFETNKKATVKTISNSGSNFSFLNDTHPITNVGRLDLILVSETGSQKNDYVSTMSFDFGVLENSISNYTFFATATSSLEKPSGSTEAFISFSNAIYNTAGPNYSGITNTYTFSTPSNTTGSNGTRVKFNANILLYSDGNPQFKIQFIKNTNDVIAETVETAWSTLASSQLVSAYNEIGGVFQPYRHRLVTFSTPFLDFNSTDTVRVKIINLNPNYRIATRAGSSFSLTQEYSATRTNVTSSTATPYWRTGSNSNPTVLTASSGLTSVYNIGYKQFTPPSSSEFGFPTINTEFNDLRVGDKIRFEFLEEQKYSISEIIPNGPSGNLCLKLDGSIPTNTQLNHFILYRVVNDGSSIILDVNKTILGEEFTGILQPQYVSSEVSNNYNQIIQSLTEKSLIS